MKNNISGIILTVLTVICLFSNTSIAKEHTSLFEEGNTLYIALKYEESIKVYEDLIKTGFVSAEVYFNLGNAYYKTDNIPAAILNYERAKKINPTDEDILFNLQLANLQTVDKIEAVPEVFYKKWWNGFVNNKSADEHTMWGIIFLWASLAISLIYLYVNNFTLKRITFFISLLLLCISLFTFYLSSKQVSDINNNKSAIIFSTNVYVKSSPDEKSTNLFMLHAGTKVSVTDELKGWKRIRISNGNEGWVVADALNTI